MSAFLGDKSCLSNYSMKINVAIELQMPTKKMIEYSNQKLNYGVIEAFIICSNFFFLATVVIKGKYNTAKKETKPIN